MPATVELIVTGPDGAIAHYPMGEKPLTMGRLPECEVVLTDPLSSRRHVKIEPSPEGTWYAQDLGSANGTILNGQQLKARVALRHGDTIQIGATTAVLRMTEPAGAAPAGGLLGGMAPMGLGTAGKITLNQLRSFDLKGSVVKFEEDGAGFSTSVDQTRKAGQSAVSAEEAATFDVGKLKRVTERLKVLLDIGQAMGHTLNPHALLSTALDKLFEVFPQADRGIIVLYGPDGSMPTHLTNEAQTGDALDRRRGAITKVKQRSQGSAGDREIRLSRTVVGRVRKDRSSVLVSAGSGDAAGLSMAKFELKSLMCAPLLNRDQDLGLLQIETKSRDQAFTVDDLELLNAVAGQVAVVITNAELAQEAAASAAQRENLSHFLSPQLVDEVLTGKLAVSLGGSEKKGTIFFSDIVGFTKLAAKMGAADVVTLLNRYFTVMQNLIFRRGGSIDKCAGDNIMAHWGVIGDLPEFTAQGVTAAVEMQVALFAFNRDEAGKKEIALPPVPLGHGIGLNTGVVCAGNIGSDRKIEFTVIGDTVNLSARIEAMAGRGQTFVGQPTWDDVVTRAFGIRMPDCPAKNVEKPVPVISIRGIVPPPAAGAGPAGTAPQVMLAAAPAGATTPALPQIAELLFALPCKLRVLDASVVAGMAGAGGGGKVAGAAGDGRVAGMVTRITPGPRGSAKLLLQVEVPLPADAEVELTWDLPEKPSLPALAAFVAQTWQAPEPAGPPNTNTPILTKETMVRARPCEPGTAVLHVVTLHPDIAAWGPGTLLRSDLRDHTEILRV
ncbi:MAG: FHA domain-containing protein [Planctomycetes bacterium]|nr:FHA domain-containing protein [Planctomycetota bacterium]